MKDVIKRLFVIIIFGIFFGYLVYCMLVGKPIVQQQYENVNILFYIVLLVISLYIAVFYGLYPIHIEFSRSSLFVIGLSTIIMGKTVFLNDPMNNIFFGDLCCVLGVITLIIGPTNLIVTSEVKKKKEEKNLEIIEV